MARKKFVERWAVIAWKTLGPEFVFEGRLWESEKAAMAKARLAIRQGRDGAIVMKSVAEFVQEGA